MEERIAENISGLNPVKFESQKSERIFLGSEHKEKVGGKVKRGNQSRNIFLVERGFGDSVSSKMQKKFTASNYIFLWREFKAAGLPVVPTLRKTERGTILVTDEKAKGGHVFGKGFVLSGNKDLATGLTSEDLTDNGVEFYLNILENSSEEIKSQAIAYANLATENAILLPYDDPFELVVEKNGEWRLVILDLSNGEIKSFKHEGDKEKLNAENLLLVSNFMEHLRKVQLMLKK